MTNTITMMHVGNILRQAKGSLDIDNRDENGDLDWFAILAGKVSHAHFDNLCDTIMAEGFTIPIVLVGNSSRGYTIGNGHHRLCAAILLGLTAIPVVINDDDYWAFEDSHDGEWNPGDRSFEYWEMLNGNFPSGYWGDAGNEIHRAQFANRPDADDDDDNGEEENYCGNGCGYYNGPEDWHECPEEELFPCVHCLIDNGADAADEHRMGCPDREWDLVYCWHCGHSHYLRNMCDEMMGDIRAEAIVEHGIRGFTITPAGMWHPEYILADAYSEHEGFINRQARDNAEREWRAAVDAMREAIRNPNLYVGVYQVTELAETIVAKRAAYDAIIRERRGY